MNTVHWTAYPGALLPLKCSHKQGKWLGGQRWQEWDPANGSAHCPTQLPIIRPGCYQCFWLIGYKLEVPQNQPCPLLNLTLIWYDNLLEWLIVILKLFSCVWLFATPWTAAHQASLTFTISWNSLRLMSMQWCYLTISSSVVPFSSCLQSLPASESFQHFTY